MSKSVELVHSAESAGRGGGARGRVVVAQGRAHQEVAEGLLRALVSGLAVHIHLVALVQLELLRRKAGSLDAQGDLHLHLLLVSSRIRRLLVVAAAAAAGAAQDLCLLGQSTLLLRREELLGEQSAPDNCIHY